MGSLTSTLGGTFECNTVAKRTTRTFSLIGLVGGQDKLQKALTHDLFLKAYEYVILGGDCSALANLLTRSPSLRVKIFLRSLKNALHRELSRAFPSFVIGQVNKSDFNTSEVEKLISMDNVLQWFVAITCAEESKNVRDEAGNYVGCDENGPTIANFARCIVYVKMFRALYGTGENSTAPMNAQCALMRVICHLAFRSVLGAEVWLEAFGDTYSTILTCGEAAVKVFISPPFEGSYFRWDVRPDMPMIVFPTNYRIPDVIATKGITFHPQQFDLSAQHGFMITNELILFEFCDHMGNTWIIESTRLACDSFIKSAHVYMTGWNLYRAKFRCTEDGRPNPDPMYQTGMEYVYTQLFDEHILPPLSGVVPGAYNVVGVKAPGDAVVQYWGSLPHERLIKLSMDSVAFTVVPKPDLPLKMMGQSLYLMANFARIMDAAGLFSLVLYDLVECVGSQFNGRSLVRPLNQMVALADSPSMHKKYGKSNAPFMHILPYVWVAMANFGCYCYLPHLDPTFGNGTHVTFLGGSRQPIPGDVIHHIINIRSDDIRGAIRSRDAMNPLSGSRMKLMPHFFQINVPTYLINKLIKMLSSMDMTLVANVQMAPAQQAPAVPDFQDVSTPVDGAAASMTERKYVDVNPLMSPAQPSSAEHLTMGFAASSQIQEEDVASGTGSSVPGSGRKLRSFMKKRLSKVD